MAREKKTVHKVQMTDGKRQIIQQLLQEYDIETTEAPFCDYLPIFHTINHNSFAKQIAPSSLS
jgi:hypothetical protein